MYLYIQVTDRPCRPAPNLPNCYSTTITVAPIDRPAPTDHRSAFPPPSTHGHRHRPLRSPLFPAAQYLDLRLTTA